MKRIIFLFFSMALANLAFSQSIISAKDFAAELKSNKSLVVIDVLGADGYANEHIAGAINIPHKSLYKDGPVEGQLKTPEELAAIFAGKGVSNTAKIVLYDDGSQKYNSRVWWILKYIGANDVWLLQKDMGSFEQARIPLTSAPAKLKATTFAPTVNASMNIVIGDVKALASNNTSILLDAREKDEYEGADKDKRSKGHLPEAVWMNFKEVLTPTGAYKSKDEIIASAAKFGATPDKDIVVYCQTGIKASVLYIALKEIAGFPSVKLYAGAYAEWVSQPDNQLCLKKLVADHK